MRQLYQFDNGRYLQSLILLFYQITRIYGITVMCNTYVHWVTISFQVSIIILVYIERYIQLNTTPMYWTLTRSGGKAHLIYSADLACKLLK